MHRPQAGNGGEPDGVQDVPHPGSDDAEGHDFPRAWTIAAVGPRQTKGPRPRCPSPRHNPGLATT